jgi:hypothetical protein
VKNEDLHKNTSKSSSYTKKNKSTGTSDAWNEYHGKGTVTHLGKDGHVKVKSHDTGKIHKFSYYGKGIGRDSEDMAVHRNKNDIHSLRNVKEEVDLDEGKMGQLSADLKDLSHADFHKEYGNPKSHYDPSNFKKPVQKGKEMDRVKSLAQRAMASMKKEEVESLEEYKSTAGVYKHQGTYGTEKSIESGFTDYDKENELAKKHLSPKKPVKKGARQNRNFNTKLYKEGFSALISSYSENGMKGLFESLKKEDIIVEEPTSAEFAAQLDDVKKRAAGTKKQPEVSKPAVQAVQNEEVELTLEDFTFEELEEFMQTEEYEQLDELSKGTLRSYLKGSKSEAESQLRGDVSDKAASLGRTQQDKDDGRYEGAKKAKRKLAMKEQTHTTVEFIDYNDVNGVKYAEIDLAERKLTDAETEKKEDTVKSMKKGLAGFKERYGKDAKSVMYATATKQAKGE